MSSCRRAAISNILNIQSFLNIILPNVHVYNINGMVVFQHSGKK